MPPWLSPTETVITVLAWYGFFAWFHLLKTIKLARKFNAQTKAENRIHQLTSFIYLALWLGAKPQSYFQLDLSQIPKQRWLDFIYPQEQAFWHEVHDSKTGGQGRILLSDKAQTAAVLKAAAIGSVETLKLVPYKTVLNESDILLGRDLFIKPNSANAMRGCLKLQYDSQNERYLMTGYDLARKAVTINDKLEILELVNSILIEKEVLLQPVLRNHTGMSQFLGQRDITTIRLITAQHHSKISLVNAVIEMPNDDNRAWHSMSINVTSGAVDNSASNRLLHGKDHLIGVGVPCWAEIMSTVVKAHELVGPITTVCWDVCVTESGPVVIEGNSDWGVASPQQISNQPLLQGVMLDAYLAASDYSNSANYESSRA